MALHEELSDSQSEDDLDEDMEALKRACKLIGEIPDDGQRQRPSTTDGVASTSDSSEEESDDLRLLRNIQKRCADPMDADVEMVKPLAMLPPDWSDSDDCEDDYETLRAIQRRFAAYSDETGGLKVSLQNDLHRPVQVGGTIIDSEKESSNSFLERTNAREGFLNCVDTSEPTGNKSEACDIAGETECSELVTWDGPGGDDDMAGLLPESSTFPTPMAGLMAESSTFPKSAMAFIDAINKNRSCQKLISNKMGELGARIEELNHLKKRVKILKDFQIACKKRTGWALSQKKNALVQLISVQKPRGNAKLNDRKIPAVYKGPPENPHVANYKEAMEKFAVSVSRENWSNEEKKKLVKGVKQQFQEMLFQRPFDLPSEADGSYDSCNVDSIILSIKDVDITPEKMKLFLPKVNWEQLADMDFPGRSGAECEARFLNWEDPLINHDPWSSTEDKNLLHIVQQRGLNNWMDIAESLGTNRTPFQCLTRYQRSLNVSILKREWTKEEDDILRAAVETYGESNWQPVASMMEGRTGTQCSNRWLKTLNPARKRVGKWTAEEDMRLKVAVTLFGPKTWKKIAKYVTGRTQVQCRERWVNVLDPSLNTAPWTDEEDSKLEAAIQEHGYRWSKVATCIPRRTDNQCWRRWKALFPNDVPRLQAARKVQKAALISNFVDRESERPALGPSDFVIPETFRITGDENVNRSRRSKRRSSKNCSKEDLRSTDGSEIGDLLSRPTPRKRRSRSTRSSAKTNAGPTSDGHLSPCADTSLLDMSNGEEIRQPHANDGQKPRMRKKKLGVKSKSTDSASVRGLVCEETPVIDPISEEHEHSNPNGECILPTFTWSDLQMVPVGDDLGGGDDATQSKKASKLQPRRRRAKILEAVPENVPEADTQTGEAAIVYPKPLMCYTRKRKRTQESCSNRDYVYLAVDDQSSHGDKLSSCQTGDIIGISVSGNLESSASSDRDEGGTNPASFLPQSSAKAGETGRTREVSQLQISSSSVDVSIDNEPKRRRTEGSRYTQLVDVDDRSRNRGKVEPDPASESEVEDDTTLACVYRNLKKRRKLMRRSAAPKI